MKSGIIKRSIVLNGHKTSVSLEEEFFDGLKEIAALHEKPISDLVTEIDRQRQTGNLSSALRLFVLSHYQNQKESK